MADKNPEGDKMPLNEEHMEALQSDLDTHRYNMLEKMTEEEKIRFRRMEEIVVELKGLKIPFFLLAAPEDDEKFWRYQSFSKESFPPSEEELKKIQFRIFNAYVAASQFYCQTTDSRVQLQSGKTAIPYYQIHKNGNLDFNPTDAK